MECSGLPLSGGSSDVGYSSGELVMLRLDVSLQIMLAHLLTTV